MASGTAQVSDWQTVEHPAVNDWQDVTKAAPVAGAPPATPEGAASRFAENFIGQLNPFPALKHYLYDVPREDQEKIQKHLGNREYGSALATILQGSAFGGHVIPDAIHAQAQQFVKAYRDTQDPELGTAGKISSTAGHVAAGLLPGVGPAAANAGEQIGSGDVAGGLGSAAGLLANVVVPEAIGKAVGKVSQPAAAGLARASEENYAKAINPTTKAIKAVVEKKIAPGLRQRGVMATSREDLIKQAQNHLDDYGQQIDDFMAQNGTAPVDGQGLIASLEKTKLDKARGLTIPSVNKPYVSAIGEIQNDIDELMRSNGGNLTLEDIRWLRQQYDTTAAAGNAFALAPAEQSKLAAITDATNTIRGHIAQGFPDLDQLNKEFSFWRNTNDVTQASKTRIQGQKQPLTEMMAKPIGAAIGMSGGVGTAYATAQLAGQLAKFSNSMLYRSLKAQTQSQLSDMIRTGDLAGAATLATQATGGAAIFEQAKKEGGGGDTSKPPEPTDVERVSEHTPNPPTAALPTTPESPATIDMQLEQLGQHLRRVVMLPKGTPAPLRYPNGVAITSDSYGNIYAYDPGTIKKAAIHSAAKRNKLPEILGSTQLGLGAPDKAALPPDAPVVTAHAPNGIELQSTATSPEVLPLTIAATQAVTPPGGRVSIGRAPQVLRGRPYQGVQQPEPLPDLAAPAAF